MAKTDNLSDFLTDVANSIRTKKGTTGTINAQNFSSEIASIETGITPTGSIDITSNGTVDVTNYASANVNVANQNPYTAANATEMAQYLASKYYGAVVKYTGTTGTYTNGRLYKVIQVTSNEYAFEELITPVGSTTKTANGTYDVKEYAEVVVNVANQNPYIATTTSEMATYLASKYDSAVVKYTGTSDIYTNGYYYKVYAVSSNEWTFKELITPVGSVTKTANGTYNVKEYESVVVNVPSIIEVSTADEMAALLIEANVGKVYRFTGTTDSNYTNGDLYEVVSE